jgi:hypothetical protein
MNTPNTHIHDRILAMLGINKSIKSGAVSCNGGLTNCITETSNGGLTESTTDTSNGGLTEGITETSNYS